MKLTLGWRILRFSTTQVFNLTARWPIIIIFSHWETLSMTNWWENSWLAVNLWNSNSCLKVFTLLRVSHVFDLLKSNSNSFLSSKLQAIGTARFPELTRSFRVISKQTVLQGLRSTSRNRSSGSGPHSRPRNALTYAKRNLKVAEHLRLETVGQQAQKTHKRLWANLWISG